MNLWLHGVKNQVKCLCFDTTSVSSEMENGTWILLEQKLGKDMIWLACRHHILEIVLEAVVLLSIGPSKIPNIMIFMQSQSNLIIIYKASYQVAIFNDVTNNCVFDFAKNAFAEN